MLPLIHIHRVRIEQIGVGLELACGACATRSGFGLPGAEVPRAASDISASCVPCASTGSLFEQFWIDVLAGSDLCQHRVLAFSVLLCGQRPSLLVGELHLIKPRNAGCGFMELGTKFLRSISRKIRKCRV